MSELLESQTSLIHSISRTLDNFKKIGRPNYTAVKIRSRMTALKATWERCLQGHAALLKAFPPDQRDAAYFKEKHIETHEETYQAALDYMSECLEELEPCVSPTQSIDQSYSFRNETSFSLKHLPPIQLPPFSGKPHEWENFRDRFDALIIQNKELTDFARMHFLTSSLTGSARHTIANLSITSDNFSVAWKSLTARYENKRKLIETYITALHDLPAASRESAGALYALRDQAEHMISAFKRLSRTSDEMLNDIFIYFISRKLDDSTRRAWKLKCSADTSIPKYDDFIKFVSSRALALEELLPSNNAKSSRVVKSNNATASNVIKTSCELCKAAHYLNKCPQFLSKTTTQRRDFVKQSKRCFNCLSGKHSVNDCKSLHTCRICSKKHHSLLHIESTSSTIKTASVASAESESTDTQAQIPSTIALSSVSLTAYPTAVLLATAKVTVTAMSGRALIIRALLDQGSEVTFITENLAQSLRLNRTRTFTTISAVGCANIGTCKQAAFITVSPRDKTAPKFSTNAFILTSLTKYSPRCTNDLSEWPHLSKLHLADDDPTGSLPIDIIIGADLYSQIITNGIRKGRTGQPIAQNSHLGWLISGPTHHQSDPRLIQVHHCSLERELRQFWEVEEVPRQVMSSPEETRCETHFLQTHSRNSDGRYIVRLPFKQQSPTNIGES